VTDRLQPGIYFRAHECPPAAYGLLLLDAASGTRPAQARHAIARIVEPQPDVDVLIGFGRRLFDHSPPLTHYERPAFLTRLAGYPLIPWTGENVGEADMALQVTGPHAAAVNCAAVAVWERIADEGLPLKPASFFTGFGRPDGRGWLGFHDGVSNLPAEQRLAAIEGTADLGWMAGGTYMAFLRFTIDLKLWRCIPRAQQEMIVGRDKMTGRPLGGQDEDFADPPETTSPEIALSHIHRANRSRVSPGAPSALRMFRQGYDFLESIGPEGPVVGLNFVSFLADLGRFAHLMHLPGWLGDVNFGGEPTGSGATTLIRLAAGGLYAVPPLGAAFPGAELFTNPDARQA
jgi:Dyp-type peroxidase family